MQDTPLSGLSTIAHDYDAIICDVWGVLHDGVHAHAGAPQALERFRDFGAVVLVTNSPRPSGPVVAQLETIGVPTDAFDGIVASGDVVRQYLMKSGFKRPYHIGVTAELPIYEGTGAQVVSDPAEADIIVIAGLRNDEVETPEDYRDELARCLASGAPLVCANPDIIVERGHGFVWCGGALARLYEELGGKALQLGKPHPPIYEAAMEMIRRWAGPSPRVLAIGDGLPTDITGANRQGFDVLFITEGIHAAEVGEPLQPDPAKVAERVAKDGLKVNYFMPRLVW